MKIKSYQLKLINLKHRLNDMETVNHRDNLTFTGLRIPYADVVASQKPAETAGEQTAPSATVLFNQVVDICYNMLEVPVKVENISVLTCYQKDHQLHHLLLALNLYAALSVTMSTLPGKNYSISLIIRST